MPRPKPEEPAKVIELAQKKNLWSSNMIWAGMWTY